MNKLADEFEAHKAAIVDLFGPGDGIIEAAELADQLSALAADTLSRWWPGVVRTIRQRQQGRLKMIERYRPQLPDAADTAPTRAINSFVLASGIAAP